MGFYSFTALIDMKPEPGATYIHSASEPYNEEQEISQERINARMDHFRAIRVIHSYVRFILIREYLQHRSSI